jgi:Kef-type K+ transport system membrane component KefB
MERPERSSFPPEATSPPPLRYGIATRIAFSLLMFAVMGHLRAEGIFTTTNNPVAYALVSLGFILLAAHNVAIVLGSLGLPHVTAYLLVGIVSGPFGFNLLAAGTVKELGIVNNLALGLIAFIAGGELRLSSLRERWKPVALISLCETALVFGGSFTAFWLLSSRLPFLAAVGGKYAAFAVSLVFAGCVVVNSPAVVIGLMNEYRPVGPMSQTTLGVVVVKDVLVVVIFGFTLAIAQSLTTSGNTLDPLRLAAHFGKEIALSVALGVAIGFVIAVYLKYIHTNLIIFTVGIALFSYQIATALQLEAILLCLMSGFFVENFTKQGETFIQNVERTFGIVFVIFFTVAGAKLNLAALSAMWYIALGLVAVRVTAIWLGVRVGATLSKAPDTVRKHTWTGLVPQAGVALGFAVIVEQKFPGWGPHLGTILVSMIGLNETVGPILYRIGLSLAGELNRGQIQHDRQMLQDWNKPAAEENGIW